MAVGNCTGACAAFQQAIEITPEIVRDIIAAIRKQGAELIVALYEADAQLAFLYRSGYVKAVISEDSDMIPFLVSNVIALLHMQVIYKMDRYGYGQLFDASLLCKCGLLSDIVDPELIRATCIIAGCDYLDSPTGLALRTAIRLIRRFRDPMLAIRALRSERTVDVPPGYEAGFRTAAIAFRHQRVFNPISRTVEFLEQPVSDMDPDELAEIIGVPLTDEDACAIAAGDVDPESMKPYVQKMILLSLFSSVHQESRSVFALQTFLMRQHQILERRVVRLCDSLSPPCLLYAMLCRSMVGSLSHLQRNRAMHRQAYSFPQERILVALVFLL